MSTPALTLPGGVPAREPLPLDALFRARSVAVVGASSDPRHVGRQILDNLVEFGYRGRVYPVNPKAREVRGLRCYPSVRELPGPVELAVLIVPRAGVLPVVEDCLAAGVRGLVVVTGGFRELDEEGARLESELREKTAAAGVPLLGPNCMGLFNTDPDVRLNVTFSPAPPRAGHVAFLSQSGALGAQVLTLAQSSGLGFSLFASLGNEAGVTHREALEYAAADPLTRVVALYLERFHEPQEFVRLARLVSCEKPIACLKGGRTESGACAARSHTGALASGPRAFEAAMKQSGVVLVDTTEEMVQVAHAFATVPVPRGRRVRLLTNAGGPGVLATDRAARRGLELPPLGAAPRAALRRFLTPQAIVGNPVDMTVEGMPEMYGRAARVLLEDEETDALVALFVEPPGVTGREVLQALSGVAGVSSKPVVAAFPAQPELFGREEAQALAIVAYPESAAGVLDALARYARWKERPAGRVRRFAVARRRAAHLFVRVMEEGRKQLDVEESLTVLEAYGIPGAPRALVRRRDALAARARRLDFPLAMKAVAPDLLHKTEAGGVVLNLANQRELTRAYREVRNRTTAAGVSLRGVLLQKMVATDREMIFGFRREPQGVPLLLAGLGGIFVEALEAVSVRMLPLTDRDAREMLDELPGGKVLGAFRGLAPVARWRLEEMLLRLAALATDFDAIAEIDTNPFAASADPAACLALDARILLR